MSLAPPELFIKPEGQLGISVGGGGYLRHWDKKALCCPCGVTFSDGQAVRSGFPFPLGGDRKCPRSCQGLRSSRRGGRSIADEAEPPRAPSGGASLCLKPPLWRISCLKGHGLKRGPRQARADHPSPTLSAPRYKLLSTGVTPPRGKFLPTLKTHAGKLNRECS